MITEILIKLFKKLNTCMPWTDENGNYTDENGFWVGRNGGASGILPICPKTKRLCLGFRSNMVYEGECWGVFGGAIQNGMNARQSAAQELQEETGYRGSLELIPSYVFHYGKFSYQNFLGIVPHEFRFHPEMDAAWENYRIKWFTLNEFVERISQNAAEFHFGVIALAANNIGQIEKVIKPLVLSSGSSPHEVEFFKNYK
ncbi:NUDIX domain protein [uncultured archaeon]|nr:NUDIX domain protein [uncultured archaeon]